MYLCERIWVCSCSENSVSPKLMVYHQVPKYIDVKLAKMWHFLLTHLICQDQDFWAFVRYFWAFFVFVTGWRKAFHFLWIPPCFSFGASVIPDAELIPAIRVPQVGILPEELGNPGLQMDDHLRSGKPGANTLGCWDAHIASRVAMSISCFFSFMFFLSKKPAVPPHGARPRCTLLKSAMNPGVLACQVPVLEHGERYPGHFSHDFHLWLGKATCFLWENPSFYRQNLGLKFEDLPLDAFGMESGSLGRNGLCWNMLGYVHLISFLEILVACYLEIC